MLKILDEFIPSFGCMAWLKTKVWLTLDKPTLLRGFFMKNFPLYMKTQVWCDKYYVGISFFNWTYVSGFIYLFILAFDKDGPKYLSRVPKAYNTFGHGRTNMAKKKKKPHFLIYKPPRSTFTTKQHHMLGTKTPLLHHYCCFYTIAWYFSRSAYPSGLFYDRWTR